MNATVEAEAVDAGVPAHCEMANDLTERENFDHREPNPRRVAKAEHENRKAPRFRAVQDEEGSRAAKVRSRWRLGHSRHPTRAVNILAAADPDAAEPEPFPPGVPFCSDGIVRARADVAEFGAVVRLVGAVLGTTVVIFGVVVTFGSVVVTFGSVVVTFGSVVVTFGSVVVTFGSVVVTFGSVVVTFGSVVVTFGSVVVTFGSVVVTFGSVVLTGSVVVIVGSAVVIARAGAADGPGTAVLARKPRIRRTVKGAATLTAP